MIDRIREEETAAVSFLDLSDFLNLANPVNPVYSFSSVVFLDTLSAVPCETAGERMET
jgi:hypothetical protein